MAGTWDEDEVDHVVDIYFAMLSLELAREPYSKTEFNRQARADIQRSRGSIEFKFQNVSAVLAELGAVYIDGYKPARNVQGLLRDRVTRKFLADADLRQDMLRAVEKPASAGAVELTNPEDPPSANLPQPQSRSAPRRVDYAAIEASNRSLGLAGELSIVRFERDRLTAAGRKDLAARVRHVSVEVGDALGYDVHSFDPETATDRYLEVKTTRFSRGMPFHLTPNELQVADGEGPAYEICRLYGFGRPRTPHYRVSGPLTPNLDLRSALYLALPRILPADSDEETVDAS